MIQMFCLSVAASICKHQYLTRYSNVHHKSTKTTICLLRLGGFSPIDIFIAFALGTAAAEYPA